MGCFYIALIDHCILHRSIDLLISMSIFEYDKELEERKLRKAEYEAGVADGIKTATENIKREDALSLVDLGLSVEQIATALKIDLKTIQKWIEQNPQSEGVKILVSMESKSF